MSTNHKDLVNIEDQDSDQNNVEPRPRRHPLTLENSPEETLKRMRALPERAAKFREMIRALRETNARWDISSRQVGSA